MLSAIRFSLFLLLLALAASGRAATDDVVPGRAVAGPAAPGHAADACPPEPQKPTKEMLQAAARNATDHGYLWRISRGGRTSYLYGTMHVGKPEWMFPGPEVMAAFRAADTVALELDAMDPDVMERTRKGLAAGRPAPLPEKLAQRMRRAAEALCVPYEGLTRALPMPEMQVTALSVIAARREGLDSVYAADTALDALAHRENKNVVSLETPELQLQTLLMKTPQETAAFVAGSLAELESSRMRPLLRRQAAAWANSDYAEMEHYADWCECVKTDAERALMQRMLDRRNPGMAERIDALHAIGKQVFAAVGSLHLFGPAGLPALMEKRGYQVERVELGAGGKN